MSELKQLINSAEEMIKDEESPEKVLNALLTDLKAYEKFNGWIPVSERLPKEPKPNPLLDYRPLELYLVSVEGEKYPFRAFWNGRNFADGINKVEGVIAWQPLPEPWKGVDR